MDSRDCPFWQWVVADIEIQVEHELRGPERYFKSQKKFIEERDRIVGRRVNALERRLVAMAKEGEKQR